MTDQPRDAFLEACGLTGPLELLVSRPGEPGSRRCLFEQPFVLIGRDRLADLGLEHAQVSRQHAYLQMIAGRLFCVDLDTRSGTHVDGRRRRSGWLEPGQTVRIGPFEIAVVAAGRASATAAPDWNPIETRLPDASAGQRATVELFRGGRAETRCRLTRVLTLVGRSPVCRVRLSSREVSKFHCGLLRTPSAVWVIDLLGTGGIRVDGVRALWGRLAEGHRLQVGEFEMRLRSSPDPASGDEVRDLALLPAPRAEVPAPFPLTVPQGPVALDASSLGPVVHQFGVMQQQMFDQFHQAMMTMVQMFGALHRDQLGLIRDELDRLHGLTQELQSLRAEMATQPPAAAESAGPTHIATPAAEQVAAAPEPAERRRADPTQGGAAAAPMPGQQAGGNIHVWLSQRIAALEQERQSRWQKVMSFVLGK